MESDIKNKQNKELGQFEPSISVCFTGHREIPAGSESRITELTKRVIMELYKKGFRNFITGGALGFDTIAAKAVLDARAYYGDVTLTLCLPCKNQTHGWKLKDVEAYNSILSRCNKAIYVEQTFTNDCMRKRNYLMVDSSACCVAFMLRQRCGTSMTVNYASKKNRTIYNIATML